MFELEEVRTWERNPQFYADSARVEPRRAGALHARAGRRARAPRALEAAPDAAAHPGGARQHQGSARHLRQGRHRDDARRAEVHRRRSAARVRRRRRPAPARRSRRRADRGVAGGRRLHRLSRNRARAEGARARSGSAATSSSRSCGSTKASTLPVDRLLAIADARAAGDAGGVPVARRQDERRRSAGRLGEDQGAASGAGRAGRRRPRSSSTSSQTFLERQTIITLPPGEPITVAPTPDFYRWSFASMWTPGPFESKPTRAYYYLTDVDPSWPAERQDEHLRDYNFPTLWSISIHEVYPGTLPALSAPAPGRVEGAQVDPVRAGVLRRRLGALLRADDDRGRLRPPGSRRSSSASSPKR